MRTEAVGRGAGPNGVLSRRKSLSLLFKDPLSEVHTAWLELFLCHTLMLKIRPFLSLFLFSSLPYFSICVVVFLIAHSVLKVGDDLGVDDFNVFSVRYFKNLGILGRLRSFHTRCQIFCEQT